MGICRRNEIKLQNTKDIVFRSKFSIYPKITSEKNAAMLLLKKVNI